uniref:Uncharacterized protein n=1 Tax=Rhizophora mucronata TaxID=61149 RepID=A0A2P2L6P4_RHIMU
MSCLTRRTLNLLCVPTWCILTVERGLLELRKLSIEQQLWEASRREIDQPSLASVANYNPNTDSEISL